MKCSTSYTLTHVKDGENAHSYVLSATMSASASGTLSVTVYKDGEINTSSLYLYAQHMAIGSTSWTQSGITGVITGTASSSYSSVKCFKLELWDSSSKTEMLASSFVSFGQNGANGSDGDDGVGISSMVEYFGVSSSASTAPTQWKTRSEMPSMTPINKFLWSYTYTTFTDGSHSGSSSSAIIIGVYGDSVGITSITYGLSSSASTEPSSWSSTMPVASQTDYLWTKTTFSDGSVMKSYTYQSIDGDAFTETIQYGMTSALGTVPTVYSIDTSEWKKGLYVYKRIVRTRTGEEQGTVISNAYDPETQNQLMSTVRFSMTPEVGTWEKSRRKPTVLTIPIKTVIEGYGRALPEFINVPSGVTVNKIYNITKDTAAAPDKTYYNLINGVYVVEPSPIFDEENPHTYYEETKDYSISFSNNINLSEITITAVINYTNVSDSVSFTINSITIPEKAMYLGEKSSLPTATDDGDELFVGDHFVASTTFTSGSTEYTALMPYVYNGSGWDMPDKNGSYGTESFAQILYNCAYDIFVNSTDVYTPHYDPEVALEGVSYYEKRSDNKYYPVIIQTGASINGKYTKGTNIPDEVLKYYNYQAQIISSLIVTNDLELVDQTDSDTGARRAGVIRSAGYELGTVSKLVDLDTQGQSITGYRKGFYGDNDGNFEAFEAWLFRANIYNASLFNCTINGTVRNAFFRTNLEAKNGATYTTNTLTNESWSGEEAIANVRSAIGTSNVEKVVSMTSRYPSNDSNHQYSLGILVDNPLRSEAVTVNAGSSFTAPIYTSFISTLGLFNSSNAEASSGDVNYNATLTNRKRWNVSSLYGNSNISANTLYSSGCSWDGTSCGYARITSPSSTALSTQSMYNDKSNGNGDWDWWSDTFTVPSWFKSATVSVWGNIGWTENWFDRFHGGAEVFVNGSSVAYWPKDQSHESYSWSGTVSAGDTISVHMIGAQNKTHNERGGNVNIQLNGQTFANLGFTSAGFYTFSTSSKNSQTVLGTVTNRGTDTVYYQENSTDGYYTKAAVTLSSPSWSSANNLLSASLTYTYSKYQIGLNLLNSNGVAQYVISSTMYPSTEYLKVTYSSTERYNSSSAQKYYHINSTGILKSGNTAVENGKVFTVGSCTAYYKIYGDANRTNISNVNAVVWSSTSIIFETTGSNITISTSEWLSEFSVSLVALSEVAGNYADTIAPIKSESERTDQITLGLGDNRFDAVHTMSLGSEIVPADNIYSNNGMIKNVNLIPVTVTTFEQGLTYYYFSSGVLTAETAGTPVSGRQYFLLKTGGYGHFDVLSMLDTATSQRKRIDELYMKLSSIEQTLSSSANKVPSSAAVNSAIMNISGKLSDITKLWENTSGAGSGTLSESYTNFHILLYVIGKTDDGSYYDFEAYPMPTSVVEKIQANSYRSGRTNVLFGGSWSDSWCRIRFTSNTSFTVPSHNYWGAVAIYGIGRK